MATSVEATRTRRDQSHSASFKPDLGIGWLAWRGAEQAVERSDKRPGIAAWPALLGREYNTSMVFPTDKPRLGQRAIVADVLSDDGPAFGPRMLEHFVVGCPAPRRLVHGHTLVTAGS